MTNPEETHIVPIKTYVTIWIALVIFTGLTILSANLHLGQISTAVSILIAGTKASLVLLFFMNLRFENIVFKATFFATLVTLVIFIVLTYSDFWFR